MFGNQGGAIHVQVRVPRRVCAISLIFSSLSIVTGCSGGGSPDSTPQAPQATKATFPNLTALEAIVKRASIDGKVNSAWVYSTTRLAAFRAGNGANPSPADQRVDVVVVDGHFVCVSCSYPPGATPPQGRFETTVYVPGQGAEDFGLVNGHRGPQLGEAYSTG